METILIVLGWIVCSVITIGWYNADFKEISLLEYLWFGVVTAPVTLIAFFLLRTTSKHRAKGWKWPKTYYKQPINWFGSNK